MKKFLSGLALGMAVLGLAACNGAASTATQSKILVVSSSETSTPQATSSSEAQVVASSSEASSSVVESSVTPASSSSEAQVVASSSSKASFDYTDENNFKVTAPNGAPAVALACLADANASENYTYVAPDTLGAVFTKAEQDFIVAPVNLGANLYSKGNTNYQLAAVLTWGNLFFASQKADFKLADLNGADVYFFGEGTVNDAVVQYVLDYKNIEPKSVTYLGDAAATKDKLVEDANAIVLTAAPAVNAAKMANSAVSMISVQDLYAEAKGSNTFTQAALFVKSSLDSTKVSAYLDLVKASCDACTNDIDSVAAACVSQSIIAKAPLAKAAIPNCNVKYVAAADAKSSIEATANLKLAAFGGALPVDAFYYQA